jgi:phosphoadenosine phosphosulfate reductase
MKVFGPVKYDGNNIIITNHNLELTVIKNYIRVNYYSNRKKIINDFEKQLERAINCIGCGACLGSCESNALKLIEGHIKILDNCKHCQKCIKNNGLKRGCISLNYKSNKVVIN